MEKTINLRNLEKIKEFIEVSKKEYDLEVVSNMSKNNYDRAIKNFESKLEKFCTKEFQEECFQKLQKNKNGEFFEGACTKKEFLKIYFYNAEENWIVQYFLRFKVIGKTELELVLEEDVIQKKIEGTYAKPN